SRRGHHHARTAVCTAARFLVTTEDGCPRESTRLAHTFCVPMCFGTPECHPFDSSWYFLSQLSYFLRAHWQEPNQFLVRTRGTQPSPHQPHLLPISHIRASSCNRANTTKQLLNCRSSTPERKASPMSLVSPT